MVHEFILAAESDNADRVRQLLDNGADVHMDMDRAVRYCTDASVLEVLAEYGADLLAFDFQPINVVTKEDVARADVLLKYHPDLLSRLIRSTRIASHFIKMYAHHILQIINKTTSPSHVFDALSSIGYTEVEGWCMLARRTGLFNDWETFKKLPKKYQSMVRISDVSGDPRILTTLLDDGLVTVNTGLYEYLMQRGFTEFLSVILKRYGHINFKPSQKALAGIIARGHYPSICLYLFQEVAWEGWLTRLVDTETTALIALRMDRYGVHNGAKGGVVDGHWMEGLRMPRGMVHGGMPWAFTRDLHMDPVPEKMRYTSALTDVMIICNSGEDGEFHPSMKMVVQKRPSPVTTEMLIKAYQIISAETNDVYARIKSPPYTPIIEASPTSKRKRND